MRYKADDVGLLLPSFRERVEALLGRMRELGYQPVPRDTLRTPAEAAANARRGSGIADSIHCYGAAADVICDEHGWSCAQRGCGFFEQLGVVAEALGLTWGGRWPRRDMPHVQAVTLAEQKRLRSLKTAEERDAFVRQRRGWTAT